MADLQQLDVLTLTATEAVTLLASGQTTSAALVDAYLAQIAAHNHAGMHLNALISVAPRAKLLSTAQRLDAERVEGRLRGPLHGVPFIVKDVFLTHADTGLPSTTVGAPCFATARAKRTAPALQRLLDAGMILLGKANLTEFCGIKEKGNTVGWSPAGGQTQSPYVYGGLERGEKPLGHSSISGSSSGTAAGVAAGFAPLGIGTECCGSVASPANRGGLYSLKVRPGMVDDAGGFKYTDCFDCVGAMAKSTADLLPFVQALMQRTEAFDVAEGFRGLRVGFLDPNVFRLSDETCAFPDDTRQQMTAAFAQAKDRIENAGAEVLDARDLPDPEEHFKLDNDKSAIYEVAFYQLPNIWLPKFFDELEESGVRSVQDIIKFNEEHADVCLPPELPKQGELYDLAKNFRKEDEVKALLADLESRGKGATNRQFGSCDIVVALGDSALCVYTSAAGLPIATLPLSTVRYSSQNERPFGLCATARTEELLLRFMAAFEAVFPPRPLPKPLLSLTAKAEHA